MTVIFTPTDSYDPRTVCGASIPYAQVLEILSGNRDIVTSVNSSSPAESLFIIDCCGSVAAVSSPDEFSGSSD